MKRLLAILFLNFFCAAPLMASYSLELNASYDYFRGAPDGTWNGNGGAFVAANGGLSILEYMDCSRVDTLNLQLGGSYGLYNWNGRGNLVFTDPQSREQIGFLTLGGSTSWCNWTGGLVYDVLFTKHFGIYDLSPTLDQLRFQLGYHWRCETVGLWGTIHLHTTHEMALGIPIAFKAVGQLNLFWRHLFENRAQTTLWAGFAYSNSLMFPHKKPGRAIVGFAVRVPLCGQFYLDGNGSYMVPPKGSGVVPSRNYGFNLCLGLTYCFNGCDDCGDTLFLPIANHSNFFVDTSVNQ